MKKFLKTVFFVFFGFFICIFKILIPFFNGSRQIFDSPNFEKIDFFIYPNILYIFDQNFMLVPTIKLLEFSDKN